MFQVSTWIPIPWGKQGYTFWLKRNIIKIINVKDKTKTQFEENYINFKNKEFNNEQEFKFIVWTRYDVN